MQIFKACLFNLLCLALSSCASIAMTGSYYDFRENMSDAQALAYFDAEGLCRIKDTHFDMKGNWAAGGNSDWAGNLERILNLIEKKKEFSEEEMSLIRGRRIQTNMRELAAYCSWGFPISTNDTVTRYGRSRQSVMGKGVYFYFDDGLLTGWQK